MTQFRTRQLGKQYAESRLSRLNDALRLVARSLLRSATRDELFNDVCQSMVKQGGFLFASIGREDSRHKIAFPIPMDHSDFNYLERIAACSEPRRHRHKSPEVVVKSGETYISNDFVGELEIEAHRRIAELSGIRASVILPIFFAGRLWGEWSLYAEEPGCFQREAVALLEATADDISFALEKFAREESRQRNEGVVKRLAAIVESTSDAIFSETKDGIITSWNPAAERMFGYTEQESIGRSITMLSPPDRLNENAKILANAARGEAIADFETIRLRKNGQQFPASITITPLRSSDGSIVGASKIVRDITERKQAAAQLQEAQAQFKVVVDSLDEGLIIFDHEGGLRWNPAALRMHGYASLQELPGTLEEFSSIFRLSTLDGTTLSVDQWPLHRVIRGEELREFEIRIWRVDSDWERIFSFSGSRAPYGENKSLAFVTIKDVTERKLAETAILEANLNLERRVYERTEELAISKDRAESADRLKSAFLATMSHELRTPLNSIIGFTGILIQQMAGPLNPEQSKQLQMVQGSARHLLALINDVLDISKIEAEQLGVHAELFDVSATLKRIIGTVKPLADRKGLTVKAVLPASLGEMMSDERRVEQILLNLLSNALKFTQRGQVILSVDSLPDFELSSQPARDCVQFRVSDTGIGIKPDELEVLFQPFKQLDTGLNLENKGTGLGLAISRRLAQLLEGEIDVHSQYGLGTEFIVTLPRRLEARLYE